MLGSPRAGFALGLSLLALTGCKERGSAGQDSRPLPTPEPPASASPAALPGETPAPPKKRPSEEAKEPAKARPVLEVPSSEKTPSAPPAPSVTAPASGVAGAPGLPAPTASVPAITAPSAACLSRCQGALQGCLAQPVDGGVPGFGNLELCKQAFAACQAACK